MSFIRNLYSIFIDALFPLSSPEKELLTYSPQQAYKILPRAPLPPIARASSVFAYKDERTTKLVWHIKYKRSPRAVSIGGYALFQELANNAMPHLVIVPMPITPRRRRERGYNQCELLTDELKRLDTSDRFLIITDLLERTQHSSRQTLKDRTERLESARGIFSVNEDVAQKVRETFKARPIQIVVIDDVITTGSTMNEAIETLKSRGFANVSGLSLAH
jgi:ComF family protein